MDENTIKYAVDTAPRHLIQAEGIDTAGMSPETAEAFVRRCIHDATRFVAAGGMEELFLPA